MSKTKGFRRILRALNEYQLSKFSKKEELLINTHPKHLGHFEEKIYSQNGEDGIIKEIFNRIGTTNKFFVEFGIEDGTECNSRRLVQESNWSGIFIDGGSEHVKKAKEIYKNTDVTVFCDFIDKDNINDIIAKGNAPKDLDFLVVDIDGNDYYVLESILKEYSPRLVCVEYNASFMPPEEFILEYDPNFIWSGDRYSGASLASLTKLGNKMGYHLVGCDRKGVNAFFVRKDLLQDHFIKVDDIDFHYSAPKYNGFFFGHPG